MFKTKMSRRGLTAAALVTGLAVAGAILPAAAANAYSYSYGWGYANCSGSSHPSVQSEESGAIETYINVNAGGYTYTANSGSTVALHASTVGEQIAAYADLYTNSKPLAKSWSCANLAAPSNY